MRITAIEIENFKGISERVRVDLKPITLLFGANSAGKSTILHALLYMKDVLDRRNLDAVRTPVSGRALDLGGFRRFVHGQELGRTIRIGVHLEVTGEELPPMDSGYKVDDTVIYSTESEIRDGEFRQAQSDVLRSVRSASVEIEVCWDENEQSPVAFAYTVGLNGADLMRIERASGILKIAKFNKLNPAVRRLLPEEVIEGNRRRYQKDKELFEELKVSLSPCEPDAYESLLDSILPSFVDKGPHMGLKNWFNRLDPIPTFDKRETLELPAVDWENMHCWDDMQWGRDAMEIANEWAWEGTSFLAKLIIGPGKLVRDWLKNLRYIGPLRARPPRKGIPSDELSDWSEGLAAWKALEDDATSLNVVEEVSRWLAGKEQLNSGYKLERKHLAQVDAKVFRQIVEGDLDRAQLRDLLKESLKNIEMKIVETRSGLRLDPSDVGVGISQVLPIVVGALVPGGSVVAIEQPELHIHPAMQVALGDLFIEGVKTREMGFLIETHSEHLMLRLLRRIRETSDGELLLGLPEVKPEDVSVLYVDKDEGGMRISSLPIDDSGEFTERWPRGFFVERSEELF
ncbi:MAG: DUF3696 domain-containing protein [Accumulibacter sp.]|jgi:predicted ATPase|uniref:AAA family ATPase n=1 Tax=Accumulibacter sp. TaxID=2053492 RepID=UPI002FC34D68